MISFISLFRFSRQEVQDSFKHCVLKTRYHGLKVLQDTRPGREYGKLLVVTPKASGKAHDRNLLRRRLKAIFYEQQLYKIPVITVIIVNNRAININFETLKNFLVHTIPGILNENKS